MNNQPTKIDAKDDRVLSALAIAGMESILRELTEGEIRSKEAIKKIRALLDEYENQIHDSVVEVELH